MEYFKPNDSEIRDQMLHLISKYHPHLAAIDKQIAILFREKAAKKGGEAVLGKSKKVSAITNALLGDEEDYVFLIELAHDEWQNLTPDQKTALIDHCLCGMSVEEVEPGDDDDPDHPNFKCSLVAPDFYGYEEEFRRNGIWRRPSHGVVPGSVIELFGEGE